MGDTERPLHGGAVGAVRVGDTVRKPAGPWTPTVQALLRHLRSAGFGYAPEPLGVDETGRECFAFIEGEPATRPWPSHILQDRGVVALATLARSFHSAVASFQPVNAIWRIGPRDVQPGEIVCHGDLGPWNTLWRGEQLVGLIDWDMAEPGPPLLDVASLALNVVPLRDDSYAEEAGFDSVVPRARRLQVLCERYGDDAEPADILNRVRLLHERELERILKWGSDGREPWATFLRRGDEIAIRGDLRWLAEHADEVLSSS